MFLDTRLPLLLFVEILLGISTIDLLSLNYYGVQFLLLKLSQLHKTCIGFLPLNVSSKKVIFMRVSVIKSF